MKIVLPPAVSIIVPVLNEPGIINRTIEHLISASAGFNTEIIIVDGDPAGSTIKDVYSREVITITHSPGRGPQMNAGAAVAKGSVLLFLHADTRLPAGAIGDVIKVCSQPTIAGGAFSLGIDSGKQIYRLIETWANIRSRLLRIPYGDQAIFIKKNIFINIGGFAMIPLMEDIEIMKRMQHNGLKIKLIDKAVTTSARRWEKEGLIYCIIRNNMLSGLFHTGVKASTLNRHYIHI